MSKAIYHALSSVKKFGGDIETWMDIHSFFDSSKGAIADNRHRALLHTSFAIQPDGIMERIFGEYIVVPKKDMNHERYDEIESEIHVLMNRVNKLREEQAAIGRVVSTRDVFEQHLIEDYGFIPTAQDFLGLMKYESWMEGERGGFPPSHPNFNKKKKTRIISLD